MTKAIYVAGPMRGIPLWNFPEFDRAATFLRTAGWQVFNPAQHDRDEGLDERDYPNLPNWFTLEKALQWDFSKIIEAGNICLLDGWEKSSGAAKELRVAEDVGAGVWRLQGNTFVEWNYHLVREIQNGGTGVVGFKGDPTGVQWTTDPGPQVPKRLSGAIGNLHRPTLGEHRVVDPDTGAAKGQKSARTDLLPTDALLELAEHYGRGATKYADRNWEGGYKWSLSYAALLRHLFAWWHGAELDEDGFPHATAVAWHALALLTFSLRKAGTDDRPTH